MMTLKAADVMTRDVLAADPDWPLDQLCDFLSERGISGAPVCAPDGRLLGVVSASDVVRHAGTALNEAWGRSPHEYHLRGEEGLSPADLRGLQVQRSSATVVSDIMTTAVFEVSENAPVQEIADAMVRGRIHRLFVTRGGRIIGVVSALDLLKVVSDL